MNRAAGNHHLFSARLQPGRPGQTPYNPAEGLQPTTMAKTRCPIKNCQAHVLAILAKDHVCPRLGIDRAVDQRAGGRIVTGRSGAWSVVREQSGHPLVEGSQPARAGRRHATVRKVSAMLGTGLEHTFYVQ